MIAANLSLLWRTGIDGLLLRYLFIGLVLSGLEVSRSWIPIFMVQLM